MQYEGKKFFEEKRTLIRVGIMKRGRVSLTQVSRLSHFEP